MGKYTKALKLFVKSPLSCKNVPQELRIQFTIISILAGFITAIVVIFAVNAVFDSFSEEKLVCVKEQCFHATSCVPVDQKPNCTGLVGTQECVPGTLDCGQGECAAVDGKCEAIFKK